MYVYEQIAIVYIFMRMVPTVPSFKINGCAFDTFSTVSAQESCT